MVRGGGGRRTEALDDALTELGAPDEVFDRLDARADRRFEIYEENRGAVELWLRVCRYWQRAPMTGAVLYLDLGQVRQVMESEGRWPDDELLRSVQRMEGPAAVELNRK